MSALDKTHLRAQLRAKRGKIPALQQQRVSQYICQQLQQLPIIQQTSCIALYSASEGEVNPLLLAESFKQQKKMLLLPTLLSNQSLAFFPCPDYHALRLNRYGILEPQANQPAVAADNIPVIILPLVAFDEKGNRLGRGGGYYDRTLGFMQQLPRPCQPYLIGIGYEFQKVTSLLAEPWDITLDLVVTEEQIYNISGNKID